MHFTQVTVEVQLHVCLLSISPARPNMLKFGVCLWQPSRHASYTKPRPIGAWGHPFLLFCKRLHLFTFNLKKLKLNLKKLKFNLKKVKLNLKKMKFNLKYLKFNLKKKLKLKKIKLDLK